MNKKNMMKLFWLASALASPLANAAGDDALSQNGPVILIVVAIAAFVFWSGKKGGKESASAPKGETGVAKYLKTIENETGVARYLRIRGMS
jgi:hypothetical protein